jgi:hypothetical protein
VLLAAVAPLGCGCVLLTASVAARCRFINCTVPFCLGAAAYAVTAYLKAGPHAAALQQVTVHALLVPSCRGLCTAATQDWGYHLTMHMLRCCRDSKRLAFQHESKQQAQLRSVNPIRSSGQQRCASAQQTPQLHESHWIQLRRTRPAMLCRWEP